MQRNDDALELLAPERNEDASADDRVAVATGFNGIREDAIDGHRQRDVTKKRHKECLHEGGEAARDSPEIVAAKMAMQTARSFGRASDGSPPRLGIKNSLPHSSQQKACMGQQRSHISKARCRAPKYCRLVWGDEELVEMREGALLRQFCGDLVIAGARVAVEAMPGIVCER